MDFKKVNTKELIEMYTQINNFLNSLEKEKETKEKLGKEED